MSDIHLRPAGDAAWFVELDDRIDPAINERAIAIGRAVRAAGLPGVRDVVPGYRSVAIQFDPGLVDVPALEAQLRQIAAAAAAGESRDREVVRVPVCYGGEFGPDLPEVARFAGCPEETVIDLHCSRVYRVYMVGFVPGFSYMGTVDGRIAMPRRESPRVQVPAGSVGIAGEQTGIYPAVTPGGWRLVGRTPVRPFDAARNPPCLFEAGARVQFTSISRDEFARLEG